MGFRLCPTAASSRRAGAITQRTPRSTETAGTQVPHLRFSVRLTHYLLKQLMFATSAMYWFSALVLLDATRHGGIGVILQGPRCTCHVLDPSLNDVVIFHTLSLEPSASQCCYTLAEGRSQCCSTHALTPTRQYV